MNKKYTVISILLAIAACILIVYFSGMVGKPSVLTSRGKRTVLYERAKVINIKAEKLNDDTVVEGMKLGNQDIDIEILTGKYAKQRFAVKNGLSRLYNVKVEKNMEVIASLYLNDGTLSDISLYSYKRDKVIYVLIAIFFLVILAIGKLKGLKSIVSLIFTGVMVLFFMVPMMFRGLSPITAAIITAIATTVVTHLLITGWSKKSASAMLGTISGVIVAGVISYLAGQAAHLSGVTMDNAENLIYVAENSKFSINGLMFAAILIASLGAVMDVGMSIASSIYEMHSVNPKLDKKQLFNSGMNVGQDIIGTMSNTLILAFAGSSLPLIILIMASSMPYLQIMNMDLICTELIQSLAGSIGIVLTVPITAFISVAFIESKYLKFNNNKKLRG
ncbi:YibE/F family protein [Clostridium swellfunianum]|uniref:YibE/F family protein n=1 Tax=Clostridium swellfunianum TaxID=1367462 RepID=UPI00202F18F5|nr:YibE/F family protein [Clostridium swellfunianum]MCM0646948.1 YibE/F family protein [Clostridium swellfunianum]